MARTVEKFKEPTIVRAKRGWFIALFYRWPDDHPNKKGTHKRFEISAGLNYVSDLKTREKEFQLLLADLRRLLRNGFDPFMQDMEAEFKADVEQKKVEVADIERIEAEKDALPPSWTISKGIEQFRRYCRDRNLSERTISTYNTYLNNFTDWLTDAELMDSSVAKFDEFNAKDFLDEFFFEEDWKPRTYNNHLEFIRTLFNRVLKLEKEQDKREKTGRKVEYTMDIDSIEPKLDRAEKNRYYTPAVAEEVKKIAKNDRLLYAYIRWIYYSCMRPKEIRLLQIKHIDISARQIKVTAATGKTGERFVPICDELHDLIVDMKLMDMPMNHFVFGKEQIGSPEKSNKDTYGKLYRPVKEALELDEKYTLYGWKHTRVVTLLMAGFTDAEVMSLTGHNDYEGFKAYRRDMIVDTTAMQGKTVSF